VPARPRAKPDEALIAGAQRTVERLLRIVAAELSDARLAARVAEASRLTADLAERLAEGPMSGGETSRRGRDALRAWAGAAETAAAIARERVRDGDVGRPRPPLRRIPVSSNAPPPPPTSPRRRRRAPAPSVGRRASGQSPPP